MGSNFGGVPYNNVANGNLSEFHFSQQNSRLGFRIDGDWKGTHFIGYNEFDFNGTSGSTALAVSNGAIVPRLRLYWVDVRKNKVEFLAGQSWSMLTPNRERHLRIAWRSLLHPSHRHQLHGGPHLDASARPARSLSPEQEGDFRLLRRATRSVHRRFGGRLGHYAAWRLCGARLDRNSTPRRTSAGPAIWRNPATRRTSSPRSPSIRPRASTSKSAASRATSRLSLLPAPLALRIPPRAVDFWSGFNVAVLKNLRLISSNFFSDGEGRYLFGQAPDLIVRADGSLSAVHASSTIDGFEADGQEHLAVRLLRRDLHRPQHRARRQRHQPESATATPVRPTARTAPSTNLPSDSTRPCGGVRATAPST